MGCQPEFHPDVATPWLPVYEYRLNQRLMLAVADALIGFDDSEFLSALFTLTLMVGIFQLILGLLKLGKFTQFISNTVMIGFLTGVAVLVILGELGDLTVYES